MSSGPYGGSGAGGPRSRGRTALVGAVVAMLLAAPVLALAGGDRPLRVRAEAPQRPVRVSAAELAQQAQPPLPRPRPQLVEPVAGETAVDAAGAGAGVPTEPAPGSATAGDGIAPGAPTDEEVRRDLEAMQRAQARVEKLLKAGRFPISYGSGRLSWPLPGYTSISSPFGPRWGRLHAGIDIPAPIGTRIAAADSGTVVIAGYTGGYGNYTCIQHTRQLSTCYAHQSRMLVRPGEDVTRGQVIGLVGSTGSSTGPHLHFEVRIGGRPVDPMGFL